MKTKTGEDLENGFIMISRKLAFSYNLSVGAKWLYSLLRGYSKDYHPSQSTLAKRLNVHRSTVAEYEKELELAHVIKITREKHKSNVYEILPESDYILSEFPTHSKKDKPAGNSDMKPAGNSDMKPAGNSDTHKSSLNKIGLDKTDATAFNIYSKNDIIITKSQQEIDEDKASDRILEAKCGFKIFFKTDPPEGMSIEEQELKIKEAIAENEPKYEIDEAADKWALEYSELQKKAKSESNA